MKEPVVWMRELGSRLREEDSGSAFNDSLQFFRLFVSSKVSMVDLIAISVSVSVGNMADHTSLSEEAGLMLLMVELWRASSRNRS